MNTPLRINKEAIFCQHGPVKWQTCQQGSLLNQRLAVKDLFAVKGEKNSAGNPDWLAKANAAQQSASSIDKLMMQGCEFVGFTHTDEIAYSLEGNNFHYGAAENPKVPNHACGGSTMGSAAAVAANLADIGLGTDTGGSVRIPASYCGLYGIRPSHNVIAKDGLIPLAPPFDTVGWLTSTAELLQQTGEVLLPEQAINSVDTLVIEESLFDLIDPTLQPLMQTLFEQTKTQFKQHKALKLPETAILSELADAFRILQGRAIAKQHGQWINEKNPRFSSAITARFEMAMALTEPEEKEALVVQHNWQKIIKENLDDKSCLFLPTTPTTAPKLGEDTSELRMRIITLSAIAGLSGSVQVHLPLGLSDKGHPYGFSLMMSHGHDKSLLAKVTNLSNTFFKEIGSE